MNRRRGSRAMSQWKINPRDSVIADVIQLKQRNILEAETLKKLIREAFVDVEKPPHWALSGSNEGDEPRALADEFASVPEWDSLDATFLDRTPKGLSSALSFFSDEAFRYYLPSYMIADIDGLLEMADPVFHLCHGLDNRGDELVNPRRYGNRTFRDVANHRLAVFSQRQAQAIVEYLLNRRDADDFHAPMIQSALDIYWIARSEGGG